MAEPPNISSILAALAAQRPGVTPSQTLYPNPLNPPAAGVPTPYSTGYPDPAQPGNVGGFQLPQPTNSGSLDLSGIKPVSTGTGIAEAIAKARGIAAEKGVTYDQRRPTSRDADGRLPGRGYRRSRSRSRSPPPPRRDNFRDNYNPYRDERRDDRRGGGGRDFPRDRSYSPGLRDRRGPGHTFSPPPGGRGFGGRSPARIGGGGGGAADDNSETIQIDSSLVGLIIGRQGENLRRVESETGARVQFVTGPDASGPTRGCKISGTRTAREEAKSEIFRIVEDNGRSGTGIAFERTPRPDAGPLPGSLQPALREGEDSQQIMIPDRTVGLIIGRGGETIRDLQERSGCHVNIVGEQKSVSGLRPVNLIGTPKAAAMAKELIMEIVDSDTKSLANQGLPPRDAGHAAAGGAGYGGYGGFGGGSGGGGGAIGVGAGVGAVSGGSGGGGRINDTIRVPSEAVGMIIGKGGETIKDMQNTTGCKINVSQPSGSGEMDREVGLVGTREAIELAKRAIEEKVEVVVCHPFLSPQPQLTVLLCQRGGGGRGGGRGPRDDPYSDRYSQGQVQGVSYGTGQVQAPAAQAQPQGAVAAGEADPYAAYGGYQNYAAMWYAAMAQQQQQQQQQQSQQPGHGAGEPRPPGTA
ncbi:MAG: hypothetical protein M1838_005231 [Thelocarpon superellum]|nr:MAG: hypothetical protein M1838_005231 [Thelocarpon superellum]